MPNDRVNWAGKVLAVTRKDIIAEFRTRYAFNTVMMFALVTLTVISMAVGAAKISPEMAAALFWVILFFAAMSGLAQVFIKEEASGTALLLKLSADGLVIFFGKLLFNIVLLGLLIILVVPLFMVLLKQSPQNWLLFATALGLGIIGLAGATTIIAAIVARASVKGALFTVISFPVLLPLFISLIAVTRAAFVGDGFAAASNPLQVLVAYNIVMITVSVLLFDFVWRQ